MPGLGPKSSCSSLIIVTQAQSKTGQNGVQEVTNILLNKMTEIRDLKSEFNEEIEILMSPQAEMKKELKKSITQVENSKESLERKMAHIED